MLFARPKTGLYFLIGGIKPLKRVVRVCDAICGAGKTQSAITMMNEEKQKRFIFVTLYNTEIDRIVDACSENDFTQPTADKSKGIRVRDDFKALLREGRNIATSHVNLMNYDREALEYIREGGYTLVLDEVMSVITDTRVSKTDMQILQESGRIRTNENGVIEWTGQAVEDSNSIYRKLYSLTRKGRAVAGLLGEHTTFDILPFELFDVFREIYILTYMYNIQIQAYYFKQNGIEAEYIYPLDLGNGKYRFTDKKPVTPEKFISMADKIHILEDNKLNDIGGNRSALSKHWYQKANAAQRDRVKKNVYNFFRNKFHMEKKDFLYCTYKDFYQWYSNKSYVDCGIVCNAKATNDYREKKYLAYMVNMYLPPTIIAYFREKGIKVDGNAWSKSEMIQLIFRTAVRDGNDIYIYIPSARMRGSLKEWLSDVSEGRCIYGG